MFCGWYSWVYQGIVTCQSIFSVRLTVCEKWKPTHAVQPLIDCISLISLCLWLLFLSFYHLEEREVRFFLSFFLCVCTHIEPKCWSQRGQQRGVMLLKSSTSFCLSVRCLAWLNSTQWWCWQNDRRGTHSSECQSGCKALLPQKLQYIKK